MPSVLKHSYIRYGDSARGRARAHVRYVQHRPGKDLADSEYRPFFTAHSQDASYRKIFQRIDEQPQYGATIHKLIVSPGDERVDLQSYTREVMHALSRHKGLELEWYAVEHFNTDHPHCHVIVMGHDNRGRPVRFTRDDYSLARQVGDDHIDRHHSTRPKADRLLTRLREAARSLARTVWQKVRRQSQDEQIEWRLQDLLSTHSTNAAQTGLGDLPPPEVRAATAQNRQLRRIKSAQKLWRDYSRPIKIAYGQSPAEPIQYTWRSNLRALRDLERDYNEGDPFVRSSISTAEFSKLQLWIKHRWLDDRRLRDESEKVDHLELHFSEGDSVRLDRASDPAHLKQLRTMHDRAEIFLHDPELHALDRWLSESRDGPNGPTASGPSRPEPAEFKPDDRNKQSDEPPLPAENIQETRRNRRLHGRQRDRD